MYRYYQRHEKDSWFVISDKGGEEVVATALSNGAKKLTILTINQMVQDGDDPDHPRNRDSLAYRGPLYFDIDCKGDLAQAIASGNELVQRLLTLGTPEAGIKIYLSGSKGLHILVDERLFSSGRFFKRLPEIYKEMARDLYVAGVDYSVYSGGRGNSFRIPNVERFDGRYRVPVTVTELMALDPDLYLTLVSGPRKVLCEEVPKVPVPELSALFDAAKKRIGTAQKVVIIATSSELEKIRFEPPTCVQMLCDGKNLKSEANFNQVATQLAAYIVRAGVEPMVADALASRAAEANHSSKYHNARTRREHIEAQIRYVEHTPGFSFGCNAIRALLGKRPCEGCAIEAGSNADGEGNDSDISAETRVDGYYVRYGDNWRRVTNFVLQPQDVVIEVPQDGRSPRRTATNMGVFKGGVQDGKITFKESSFSGRSTFLKEIEGISDLTFQGSDGDVQRIKIAIFKEAQDVGEVFKVYTSGIHLDFVGDEPVFTYVEPDMSINNMKVKGTHQFSGELQARPHFGKASVPEVGDKATDMALSAMLRINKPIEIGVIVGWSSACHYKTHLMYLHNQFPVLSLWGSAGSGKSITAGIVTWINGTDYMSLDSGINAPSATSYGMLDYLSSTTTIPRIIEEYNKSKMEPRQFKETGERIKQTWGGESAIKGKIGGNGMGRVNAETVVIPLSSPIIVCSEQEIEMPAIQERSLRIHLTKQKRAGRKEHFEYARKNRKYLRSFGKALMIQAMNTTLVEMEALMDEASALLPDSMDDRPRYSLQVAIVGLWQARKAAASLKLTEAESLLDDYANQLIAKYSRAAAKAREDEDELLNMASGDGLVGTVVQSETDIVVAKMAMVIALSKGAEAAGASVVALREGLQYFVPPKGEFLIIDPIFCFVAYVQFVTSHERQQPVISNVSQFLKLVMEEPYFAGLKKFERMGDSRPMLFLNIEKLREKNIDTSLITGGVNDGWSHTG